MVTITILSGGSFGVSEAWKRYYRVFSTATEKTTIIIQATKSRYFTDSTLAHNDDNAGERTSGHIITNIPSSTDESWQA
jgi:hypothetical protein